MLMDQISSLCAVARFKPVTCTRNHRNSRINFITNGIDMIPKSDELFIAMATINDLLLVIMKLRRIEV